MKKELIESLLNEFHILSKKYKSFENADNVLIWDCSIENCAEDSKDTIYISDNNLPDCHFHNSLIVCTGGKRPKADNYICLEKGSLVSILNKLTRTQSGLNRLNLALMDAESEQEILDIAARMLKVPFFYFDASYRILAITKDFSFNSDAEWRHMINEGFLSPESARLMQEAGDMDLLAIAQTPVVYKADFYPFTSIVCNIEVDGHFYSRLNRLCINGDSSPTALEECRIMTEHLSRLAKRTNREPYAGPLNNMVLDLLSGVQLSDELIHDRLSHMPALQNSLCQVACIGIPETFDAQVYSYYAGLAERTFSNDFVITMLFDKKIVVIFHSSDEEGFDALLDKLKDFVAKRKLKAGISIIFRKFSLLSGHYRQAESALEKCPEGQCVEFKDMLADYVFSFVPEDQLPLLISSDIKHLIDLEGHYSFPLLETLRKYLDCNCSLQDTAAALFIHKNTMLYRLNIIKEIIRADLSDANDRIQLMISFRLLDKCQTRNF